LIDRVMKIQASRRDVYNPIGFTLGGPEGLDVGLTYRSFGDVRSGRDVSRDREHFGFRRKGPVKRCRFRRVAHHIRISERADQGAPAVLDSLRASRGQLPELALDLLDGSLPKLELPGEFLRPKHRLAQAAGRRSSPVRGPDRDEDLEVPRSARTV